MAHALKLISATLAGGCLRDHLGAGTPCGRWSVCALDAGYRLRDIGFVALMLSVMAMTAPVALL
jgi:hypothetical protein